ncbi:protein SRC2 homolog [Punica granatum]|uniref:Protein SRC2 homolog n=2 Tax=Punica granatum TaxID=22663 RepID=A0A6P8EFY6_PUNGR|nr:protein SRC2 homolog [Punica granatum]
MEFRPLDVTVLSAKGLKDVNLMTKMDVYAVVSISGDPRTAQKTPVDKDCGSSPKWHFPMKFTLDDAAAHANRLTLVFKIMSDRSLGDREVGSVHVPVKELLDAASVVDGKKSDDVAPPPALENVMSYCVRTPKGKPKGTLEFSYRFGEKYTVAAPPPPTTAKGADEPVMAYPAMAHPGSSSAGAAYPPPGGYPHYPPPGGYPQYPPAGGYPAYPPQVGYGYPNQHPHGAQGYGYPPVQQVKPPKKSGGGKFGLGLAGGLLGGLLIGDMIGDAAEMSAYDAGGFDDGGFDF